MQKEADRIEKLILELRLVSEKYNRLEKRHIAHIKSFFDIKNQLDNKSVEVEEISKQIQIKSKEIESLKSAHKKKEKIMKASLNKKDNQIKKYFSSSKSKNLFDLQLLIEKLEKQNMLYKSFIEILACKLKFDSSILENLIEVSSDQDDPILQIFREKIQSIQTNYLNDTKAI